jgi:hypothetical protein
MIPRLRLLSLLALAIMTCSRLVARCERVPSTHYEMAHRFLTAGIAVAGDGEDRLILPADFPPVRDTSGEDPADLLKREVVHRAVLAHDEDERVAGDGGAVEVELRLPPHLLPTFVGRWQRHSKISDGASSMIRKFVRRS